MRWLLFSSILAGIAQPVMAADADRGRQVFDRNCTACHSVEPGKHMTGPSLAGLWARKSGAAEGFSRYSPALVAADIEWNEATLDRWLEDVRTLLARWLPEIVRENRSYVTVAIGCTGGRHRSVYMAERLAQAFSADWRVLVRHRGLAREEDAVA